jgi:hypothetical protein
MITAPKTLNTETATAIEILQDMLKFKQQGHRSYKDGTELPSASILIKLINEIG